MMKKVIWVGAVVLYVLALVNLCGASEYLPGRPSDTKVFEDTRFGNSSTMEIDRKLGNWRHYSTFGGFGPLWIWTGPETECIYVWSDVVNSLQMITDFSKSEGYTSRIDLDPCNRDHVIDALLGYGRSAGAPVVVVTHDHDLLSRFDRTVDIKDLLADA